MPLTQQTKLLRVIQDRAVQRVGSYEERSVRFRLIAATHVDLEMAVREKCFREDWFYRISKNVIRQADIFRATPEFATGTKVLKGLVGSYGTTLIAAEKKRFMLAIEQARGSRDEAAKILGLSRATFSRRVKELGIAKNAR